MADTNLLKRNLQDRFDSSDPFAELTRIMGREPRPETPSMADDPFDIDLEKELMGDLGDDPADRPEAAPAPAPDSYARAPQPDDAGFDAPADDGFDADRAEDAFAAEFDDVDWGEAEEAALPASAEPAPEAYAPPQDDWQAPAAPVEDAATGPADDPFGDDLGLAEVDMDFGDLDIDERGELVAAAEGAAYSDAPQAAGDYGADATEDYRAQAAEDHAAAESFAAAQPGIAEPSLEDELNRLLGSDPAGQPFEPGPAAWEPLSEPGYAGEPAPEDAADDERYAGYDDAPAAYDDASVGAWDDGEGQGQDADAAGSAWDDAPDDAADWQAPAGEAHGQGDAERADPFAALSDLAPAMPAFRGAHAAPAHAPDIANAGPAGMLDIETVEVADDHVPMQDELDLPETAFDEPAPVYDDFDAELASSFGMPSTAQPTPGPAADDAYGDDQFAEAIGLSGAAASAAVGGWGARAAQMDRDAAPADLDREIDVAGYGEAGAATASQRRRTGLMVAAAVAGIAVLGGLGALAFSLGSGGSDDTPVLVTADADPLKVKPENPGGTTVPNQDSKAYERAAGVVDTTPPTQERLVTSTEEPVSLPPAASARAEEDALPGLDEEERVDMDPAAAGKAEDRLEAAAEPEGIGAAEDLAAVQPRKVRTMIVRPDGTLVPREDPAPQPAADAASAERAVREVAIAQPQTPAPAADPAPAPAQAAAQPATPAGNASATGTAASQPAAAPATPAPEVAARQQVAQAPAAQARTEPARPAVAAQGSSEWSMQIASQPTAEAAQATYQDLARRYGSVIGGRGVNIVKADISGKGTYYRVRIPSASRAEAIALCEKYKAAGGSCFVSK